MQIRTIGFIIYALLVIVGGLIGYIKAGSTPSLTMGLASGLLILAGTLTMQNGWEWGFYLLLFTILTLLGFFLYRFILTGSFMPAGLMCLLSFTALYFVFKK